jgi:hypothetical protein
MDKRPRPPASNVELGNTRPPPSQPTAEPARLAPAPPILNRFVIRCLMHDLDPAFQLDDDAVEAVLEHVDVFCRDVMARALAQKQLATRDPNAKVDAADVCRAMKEAYGVDVDSQTGTVH